MNNPFLEAAREMSRPGPGWETDGLHVWPLHDSREHDLDRGLLCWCKPRNEGGVITHNSDDGREVWEWLEAEDQHWC